MSKILLTPRQRGHWTIIVHFVGAVPFNVVVGAFHSLSESIAHVVLLIIVGYVLLRPPASKYFQSAPSE